MKKLSMKTKIKFVIKKLFSPADTKFEVNYGNGFVVVNRFKYIIFVLKELKKIETA